MALPRHQPRLAADLDSERNRLADLMRREADGDEVDGDELDEIRMAAQNGLVPICHPLHGARVRIGSAISSVVQILMEVGTGTFVGFPPKTTDSDVEQEFERGLLLDRARNDSRGGVAPWLTGHIEGHLVDLSNMIRGVILIDAVAAMSRKDLEAHRRVVKSLLSVVTGFVGLAAVFGDENAFGFPALGNANDTAEGQQLYLLGALFLASDPQLRRAMHMIAAAGAAFPDPRSVFGYLLQRRTGGAPRS